MKLIISCVCCFLAGAGSVFLFAPKGSQSKTEDEKRVETVRSEVRATSFNEAPELILERVFSGSEIDAGLISEMKTAEDWIRLIQEKGEQKTNMPDMQQQFIDMALLMKVVPDSAIEGVIAGIQKMNESGGMQQKMLNLFYINTLADRWYSTDPETMKEWALQDGVDKSNGRVEMLLLASLEHRPEEGLALYEEHKENLNSGTIGMFGSVDTVVATSMLEVKGVKAYWEYVDTLPSNKAQQLGYQISLESGQFVEFYNEGEKRWKEGEGYQRNSQQDRLFNQWGKEDAADLSAWYEESKTNLKRGEKARVLKGLLNDSAGGSNEFIRSELASDTDLIKPFLNNSSEWYGQNNNGSIESKIALLPKGTQITGGMIQSTLSSLVWQDPEKALAVTNYISDETERFNTIKNHITSQSINKITKGDLAVLERGLEKVELSDAERAELLEIAINGPEEKSSDSPFADVEIGK